VALRELLAAADEISVWAAETRSEPWALRYLEACRPTSVFAPAHLGAEDQAKLAHSQADQIVGVIRAVLRGLGLSDADFRRGIDLAIKALRASSAQGWEPL
jgi:hypothetical protein